MTRHLLVISDDSDDCEVEVEVRQKRRRRLVRADELEEEEEDEEDEEESDYSSDDFIINDDDFNFNNSLPIKHKQDLEFSFNVFIQCLCLITIDDNFMSDIYKEGRNNDTLYYYDAWECIERELDIRNQGFIRSNMWDEVVDKDIEQHSMISSSGSSSHSDTCQVCKLSGRLASYELLLNGDCYNHRTLQQQQQLQPQTLYKVGRFCRERVIMYHKVYHYRYHMLSKVRGRMRRRTEDEVEMIMNNTLLISGWFSEYESILSEAERYK